MKLVFIFFSLLAITLVGRLCYFTEPFGVSVDESTYLSMAEVLHQGGVVFRDVVDRKPPGLFWVYQAIGTSFGHWNIHAVHFVFSLFLIFLIFMAYILARHISKSSRVGLIAAFLFAIFSSCFPREILSANAEIPMMVLLSLSTYCFLRGTESYRPLWLFVAISLAVGSFFLKQYGVLIFLPMYLAWTYGDLRRRHWKRQFAALCLVGLAVLLVCGPIVLYFYSKGALQNFLYYSLFDGLRYVANSRDVKNHSTSAWVAISGMLVSWPVLWWGLLRKIRDPKMRLILFGALGAGLTIFLSGRYYTHYFLPLIWFLSVIAALPFEAIWARFKRRLIVLTLLPFLFYSFFNFNREFLSANWPFTKKRQTEMRELSERIKFYVKPEDRMVVWGIASQIYVMSERGSGTRYVFSDFVSGRQPGFKSPVSIPLPNALDEFLGDLERNKPKAIIDTSTASVNDYQYFPFSRYPELKAYIETHYEKIESVNGFEIWIRSENK